MGGGSSRLGRIGIIGHLKQGVDCALGVLVRADVSRANDMFRELGEHAEQVRELRIVPTSLYLGLRLSLSLGLGLERGLSGVCDGRAHCCLWVGAIGGRRRRNFCRLGLE